MRNGILRDFPGTVDFRPNDNNYIFTLIDSFMEDSAGTSVLIGALHADLQRLYENGRLRSADAVISALEGRNFSGSLVELSRFSSDTSWYVPWMQATFIMAANRKALPYLPKGASLDTLTYEQLLQWSANIVEKTGTARLGFPAGEKGLMHRFFQGYLYPSFTGSALLKFRSAEAVSMWEFFRKLWACANPSSLSFSSMAEPLLLGDIWIAWDHTARLAKAFEEQPDEFVAFPAPSGPAGRGYLAVVSGLAFPAIPGSAEGTAPLARTRDAELLADYLTRPAIQGRILAETGFFPVLTDDLSAVVPKELLGMSRAVSAQASSPESITALMPANMGARGADFNKLFMLAFSEIVLRNKDVPTVLSSVAVQLQAILDAENVPCWLPDRSDARPCKIE